MANRRRTSLSTSPAPPDPGLAHDRPHPCFAAGTRICTALGPRAVETIRVGDLVETLDDGYQPVRARRLDPARAPAVVIPAGMFGDHGPLRVPPRHRLHRAGWRGAPYDSIPGVLVEVRHLVRAGVLTELAGGEGIDCHHLIFDRPQIICAEGLWSES